MDEPSGNTLEELLPQLPPGTPFFIPDEILSLWCPPGVAAGILDDASRLAAEQTAAKFGCHFQYDPKMGEWCFIRAVLA
jgi:hypothetical protein